MSIKDVETTVQNSSGEEIVYFLNGDEVARRDSRGDFSYESVLGENNLQAKLMNGDLVVASSNVITLEFNSVYPGEEIISSDLSQNNPDLWYNDVINSGWVEFVPDPDGISGKNVMHVKEPYTNAPSYSIRIPNGAITDEHRDSRYIRLDYEVWALNYEGTVYMSNVYSSCGCSHGTVAYADWPSGRACTYGAVGSSRSIVYPKKEWIKMSLLIDNELMTYDIYANGIQLINSRPLCINETHQESGEKPYVSGLALPSGGWPGDVDVVDEDGNPAFDEDGNRLVEKHHGEFYVKNVSLRECTTSFISADAPSFVPAGASFIINAGVKESEQMKYVYCVNGEESLPTDSKSFVYNGAASGDNLVVVKLVENQQVVAASDPIVVTGIDYGTYRFAQEAPCSVRQIRDVSQTPPVYVENTDRNFAKVVADEERERAVMHICLTDRGFVGESSWYKRDMFSAIDKEEFPVIKYSYSIKPISVPEISSTVCAIRINSDTATMTPFAFTTDGRLAIATESQPKAHLLENALLIDAPLGRWYEFEVILNSVTEYATLLVDGVVYSNVSFENLELDYDSTLSNTYVFAYNFNSETHEGNPSEYYLDAIVYHYVNILKHHGVMTMENAGNRVEKIHQLISAYPLNISFVAYNKGKDIDACVALFKVKNGVKKLIGVDMQSVKFGENPTSDVRLTLSPLPSDISWGDYEIAIYIWEDKTFIPVEGTQYKF